MRGFEIIESVEPCVLLERVNYKHIDWDVISGASIKFTMSDRTDYPPSPYLLELLLKAPVLLGAEV